MDLLAGYGWLAHGRLHLLTASPALLPPELWAAHHSEITTAIAALFVGIVVGITGMGGGALMTPALIFLGVGNVSAIVTADLTAAAIYKTGGAAVHWRCGSPNLRLAALLICSSVPMAFLGPHLVRWITSGGEHRYIPGGVHWHCYTAGSDNLCLAPLREVKTKRARSPSQFQPLRRASAAYYSGWRTGRTPGRCHLGRIRFADHDHPASALPRTAGSPTCRHGPDAGSAAGAFGSGIQHPDKWARWENCGSAYPRLGSRLHVWRKDRAANARFLYPPWNRCCSRHVRFGAA